MLAFMQIVASLLSAAFALFGRWIQLHPEKIVPTGHFTRPDTLGARLFRVQVALIGTIAVFGGTYGALHALLQFATFGSVVLAWIMVLTAVATGIVAAIYVRREANAVQCIKAPVLMAGGRDFAGNLALNRLSDISDNVGGVKQF
jgi:hypothetical protein